MYHPTDIWCNAKTFFLFEENEVVGAGYRISTKYLKRYGIGSGEW